MDSLLIQTNSYAKENVADAGNRYLIGNGYMGVRGTLEEYGKDALTAVNLAGIYDRYGDGWREPLNAPNPFSIKLYQHDAPLFLPEATPLLHTQTLDVRRGLHQRDTTFAGGIRLQVERMAHMQDVHLLCLKAKITSPISVSLQMKVMLDGDVWDIHGPHYAHMVLGTDSESLTALATTNENDHVAVCSLPRLSVPYTRIDESALRTQTATFAFALAANETAELCITAAVYTNKDCDNPAASALAHVLRAPDYNTLRSQHISCWADLWQKAAIRIDGDAPAERAVNYSAYHLLSIAPRHARSLSVPARGLSGQTYKGAIFWDTEMFMLDFYLATLPDVAKTLLRYRIDTLDGAQNKAKQYGLRGAFYAWESQEGGFDACSDYNVTDVFTQRPMRTYFRDKQIHISSAIVYGLYKYANWSGDNSLWLEGGTEVLIEASRFYHSLLVKRVESNTYELRDVIGPDEYHERVDNNAYTNEMARFVWIKTLEVLQWLQQTHSKDYEALECKLHFAAESSIFEQAIARLKVQAPNSAGIIEQFDGYFALEDAIVDEVRTRIKDPREYWGGAYGVASQTQVIKQADTITLLYMLRDQYAHNVRAANYNYYLPRTEHGSSLSACMYALAACGIGKPNDAYPLFIKSAETDLASGGKQWAGLVYIGGTHPAAAGGAYMTLLWGFLGLETDGDSLSTQPQLPDHWKGIRCNVYYKGQRHILACGSLSKE